MSHFTVLIVGENPEEQLAPFNEQPEGDDRKYLQFCDEEDEYRQEYETDGSDMIKVPKISRYFKTNPKEFNFKIINKEEFELVLPWDDRFAVGKGFDRKNVIPESLERIKVPFKERYSTFEEYMRDWRGHEERDPETGKYGYWHNPNAKWDWYQLGGRWTGYFKLKPGAAGVKGELGLMTEKSESGYVDQALKRNIDWESMVKERIAKVAGWYEEYLAECVEKPTTAYFQYDVRNKGDRDNYVPETRSEYIERKSSIATFAVLKDGQWYERGNMGWWGCVSDEKNPDDWGKEFDKLIRDLPDDTLISVYDCHI